MDIEDKLDALMKRLGTLGELKTVSRAPEAASDAELQSQVSAFLERFPFLPQDAGYEAFLRRYGGALFVQDEAVSMGLYGFSHDITFHIVEGPGEPVSQGCLIFGDLTISNDSPRAEGPRDANLAFGFEATGARRFGIYRYVDGGEPQWYCETFLEWLERLVDRRGRLLD